MTQITRESNVSRNYDFTIKSGSTKPVLQTTLTDGNNNPVSLDGATVLFRMAPPGGERVIDKKAVIQDPDAGSVVYVWKEGDTDVAGIYNAELVVDYEGRTDDDFVPQEYFPTSQYITIHIEEPL